MQKFMKSWSLNKLHKLFSQGFLVLPRTQRDFIWNVSQESSLVESALTDKAYIPSITVVAVDSGRIPTYYLVDGQQRVTSLINFMECVYRLRLPRNPNLNNEMYSKLYTDNSQIKQYDDSYRSFHDILNDEDKLPVTVITLGSTDVLEKVLTAQVRTLNTDARAFCKELQLVLSDSYPEALRNFILENKGRRLTENLTDQNGENLIFDRSMYKSASSETLRIQLLEAAVIGVSLFCADSPSTLGMHATFYSRDRLRKELCSDESCVSQERCQLIYKGFRRAKYLLGFCKHVNSKARVSFYKAAPVLACFNTLDSVLENNYYKTHLIVETILLLGKWDRQRRAGWFDRGNRFTGYAGEYNLYWEVIGCALADILNERTKCFSPIPRDLVERAMRSQGYRSCYERPNMPIELNISLPYNIIRLPNEIRVFSTECVVRD